MPAVIDDEPMAEARMAGCERPAVRQRTGAGLRAQIARHPQGERAQALGAEPAASADRSQCAENSWCSAAPLRQRQHQEFELACGAVATRCRRAANHANCLGCDSRYDIAERAPPFGRPDVGERDAVELAAEQGAYARSRDPERMARARIEAEDECVGEHTTNGARLDVAALRRRTRAAPLVPIIEQLSRRRMFHVASVPSRCTSASVLTLFGTAEGEFRALALG